MATINAEAVRERTTGSRGALENAFQQVMQGFSQFQETVLQQERRTEERLLEMEQTIREVKAEQKRRLQAARQTMEATVASILEETRSVTTSAFGIKLRRLEARMEALENRSPLTGARDKVQASGAEERLAHLESRMEQLEATTQRVLQYILPQKDASLNKQEKYSLPVAHPRPVSTSSASNTTSGAASASPPASSAPRPRSPSADGVAPPPLTPERRKELGEQLTQAARKGRETEVRRLLGEGADVNFFSYNRHTPLMDAASNSHENVVSLLIGLGADINARNWLIYTAMHMASFDRSGRCTSLLIRAGALLDCANNVGQTPLHLAAREDNEAAARALLSAGASTTVRDIYKKTPSGYARTDNLRRLLRS